MDWLFVLVKGLCWRFSMKVAVIGTNAYLAQGIEKYFDDIQMFQRLDFVPNPSDLCKFDYVVNFTLQPAFRTNVLKKEEIIDLNIAKIIKDSDCKLVFISSRKVYGSGDKIKKYSESHDLVPSNIYSQNKILAETELKEMLPNRYLILRVGNILGVPPARSDYRTFVGWIADSLRKENVLRVTENPDVRKDFITVDYFQKSLAGLINNNCTGTYNVGAGFALRLKDLLPMIAGEHRVLFVEPNAQKKDEFILNCDRLHKMVPCFNKAELIKMCKIINSKIL